MALKASSLVLGVEHALGDESGEDHQQAVGVGDVAGDQCLVDHRQRLVFIILDRVFGHWPNVAASLRHASGPSCDHVASLVSKAAV